MQASALIVTCLGVALSLAVAPPAAAQDLSITTRDPACRLYIHVARFENGAIHWNSPTANMKKWMAANARQPAGRLCPTDVPAQADYVVVWRAYTVRIPYSAEVPALHVPFSGAVLDGLNLGGGKFALFTEPATSGAISIEGRPAARSERGVLMMVFPLRASASSRFPPGVPALVTFKESSWPWSKPDRDALAAALIAITR